MRSGAATTAMLTGMIAMLSACAAGPAPEPWPPPVRMMPVTPALPDITPVDGPLRPTVVYPLPDARLTASDSNFIFGAIGSGAARLTINGVPVPVAPNGAYLAFLPVPSDGVYRLQATKGAETATLVRNVVVPEPLSVPDTGATIVDGSVYPMGAISMRDGDRIEVGFTGSAGGQAFFLPPHGGRVPLVEEPALQRGTSQAADFRTDAGGVRVAQAVSRYRGEIAVHEPWSATDSTVAEPRIESMGPTLSSLGLLVEPYPDTLMERRARERGLPLPTAAERAQLERLAQGMQGAWDTLSDLSRKYAHLQRRHAAVELVVGKDTTRAPLQVNLALIGTSSMAGRDPPVRVGRVTAPDNAAADWEVRGRAGLSGPFHWFWPPGTLLQVVGERAGQFNVQLAPDLSVWVPAGDVTLLPEATPVPRSTVSGVRMASSADRVDLRIGLSERLPYRVDATERVITVTVYGATSEVNFMQYGSLDPLVRHAAWSQPSTGVFAVDIELSEPVWGWQASHDTTGGLVVSMRRPPRIDAARPLSGLLIAVDPGHPPGGATGPTGLTEAEANLAVALALRPMLEAAGARVLMTRVDGSPVELGARPRLATSMSAHVLVSLHNNAFPDGVNPFRNNGSSVYYFQPQSIDLARIVQAELLAELNLRDVGIGRADLALVRTTWMPAILSETMFLMVPQQEHALHDPAVQRRIAQAHVRALEQFLRARSAARR